MRPILTRIIIIIFIIVINLIIPFQARAETMSSNSYTVRQGNFNITSGLKSSTSYSLTDTVGQTVAEYFTGTGYHVKAGFQYMYTLYDFSFSISSLLASLGSLVPATFSTASHTLTVTAPGQGYTVSAYEVTPLENSVGDTIPDTACDSGPCTETSAQIWIGTANYGFGYNLTGNDVSADFASSSYFRPFPDLSALESPATIMTTTQAGKNRVATVTYKVNSSASQAAGNYSTQIVYIATPVY